MNVHLNSRDHSMSRAPSSFSSVPSPTLQSIATTAETDGNVASSMARRGAKAAAAAVGKASTSMAEMVPASAVRNGVYVTLVFFMVYYVFLFSQAVMKRKLRAHYAAQGKKVCDVAARRIGKYCNSTRNIVTVLRFHLCR